MLKYLIPLLFLLISPIAHAEKYDRDYRNNALGGIISETEKRMEQMANDERMRKTISGATVHAEPKTAGTREIEIKKNYPVVPYDPNHPNVQKQKSSKFNVSAKAKTLAGRFGKGLNTVALGMAVAELIGEGVDWVLDPENNSVRFNKPVEGYIFRGHDSRFESPDVDEVTRVECRTKPGNDKRDGDNVMRGDPAKDTIVYTACQSGWAMLRVFKTKTDNLSLDTIAQHVINNETNNVTNNNTTNITNVYYGAVTDTLVDQIQNGEHDDDIKNAVDQLADDKTDSDTDTSTENKDESDGKTETETETETKPLGGLPAFCTWAKPVCDWLKWTKEQYEELLKEPQLKDEPIDVQDDIGIEWQDKVEKSYVSFNGQCPANVNIPISWGGATTTLHLSYEPFCRFAVLIKPAVILGAWISALMIISGGRTKE